MPTRCRALLPLLLMALLLPAVEVGAQTAPPGGGPGPEGMTSKEQQVLERIRQMKTPPWRSFGPCRYDWGGWRLSDGGVRVTTFECGEPPMRGSVAVHCETLRINRRFGEGAWEPWRLPYSRLESRSTGGEDLMVASLCANVRKGVAGPLPAPGVKGTPSARSVQPPAPGTPPPVKPKPPARLKSRV
jgi:hypothetical protein